MLYVFTATKVTFPVADTGERGGGGGMHAVFDMEPAPPSSRISLVLLHSQPSPAIANIQ